MRRRPVRFGGTALAVAVVLAWSWLSPQPGPADDRTPAAVAVPADASGGELLRSLYEAKQSGVMVEAGGRVQRVLADDSEGSRHQRFIVEAANGHTVLVAHNIDLAPRIAGLRRGEPIRFRGQYEWNHHGGVVHWTHHDPNGRREGGWLRYDGREYR